MRVCQLTSDQTNKLIELRHLRDHILIELENATEAYDLANIDRNNPHTEPILSDDDSHLVIYD